MEIAKLNIPVLILQGDKDIQVGTDEADKLHAAHPSAAMHIIKDMNHVLKQCETTDAREQIAIYSNPDLPVKPELISHIVEFIKK